MKQQKCSVCSSNGSTFEGVAACSILNEFALQVRSDEDIFLGTEIK